MLLVNRLVTTSYAISAPSASTAARFCTKETQITQATAHQVTGATVVNAAMVFSTKTKRTNQRSGSFTAGLEKTAVTSWSAVNASPSKLLSKTKLE